MTDILKETEEFYTKLYEWKITTLKKNIPEITTPQHLKKYA